MTRFGWLVWLALALVFYVGAVGTCVYQGQSIWWWPAWAYATALSLSLLLLLRRLRL